MEDTTLPEVTTPPKKAKPSQHSRKKLMEIARPHAEEALKVTVDLMYNAPNDSVRLGAAKTILNKVIPDLKAVEVSGEDGQNLEVVLVYKPSKNE